MKVLVRTYEGKEYVWLDATYDKEHNCFRNEKTKFFEKNVVSVFEDNRNDFVKCSVCGQAFKKGSEEIKTHTTPITDNSKCFDCPSLRTSNRNNNVRKYELIAGNNYRETATNTVDLMCSRCYPYVGINTETARKKCVHNICANAKMLEFSDFFTENPNAFDRIITADVIEESGYSEKYRSGNYCEYRLHLRNNVWAVANTLGIIDHFIVIYRRENYDVYYSKKYNKLFYASNNRYKEWNPDIMPESSKNLILNKIAELYS